MSSKINTQIKAWFVFPQIAELTLWFQNNFELGIGIIITLVGLILTASELRVYIKHDSTSEQLLFWLMFLITGISTIISRDFVLGVLLGISLLMVVETARMWSTPVWGKLMAATTASYLVILGGKIGQVVYDAIVQPETPNDQIFSAAFNVAFYVFLAVAFFFFGKKFILVSRFSSPQIVYLFLFGVVYVFIAQVFPRNDEGLLATYNYLDLASAVRHRILFADFGTYEALIIVMVFMYFISGYLLSFLFGVEEITDPVLLEKVRIVAKQMGIEDSIKVGYVRAPILNAFAYGPWFDKRIAFISNDINDFTDSDIRGIVGHELAHAANHHVLILLGLSAFELVLKKALLLPATTLDYTFLPDTAVTTVSFVGYYIISYGILVVLMVFVRILEGHADKKTLEAGYGDDLSKALYRLEGFYNGVASDFGISVNLLTDRTYTKSEKHRFTAQAGRNLYREVLSPTRMSAFANIFQSHPRTSYRIASLVEEDLDPMKGAFLPYRLLGFGLRKGAIKQLNSVQEKFKVAIDKTYDEDYGKDAIDEVMEFNPWEEPYFDLIGKEVISYDQFDDQLVIGTLKELEKSYDVTSPVHALVGGEKVNLARSTIKEYKPGDRYLLKDGSVVELVDYTKDEDDGIKVNVRHNGTDATKEIKLQLLGKPLAFLDDLKGKEVVFYNKGLSRLATLEDFSVGSNFFDGEMKLDGETISNDNLVISFPPLGFEVRKSKREEQLPLLKYLLGKKIMLYTKQNFDVSLAGVIEEIHDESITYRDADTTHDIGLDELEYVMFAEPTLEIINREHISLFTKFGIWWSNRKEFNYIY